MSGDAVVAYIAALDVGTTTLRCQIVDSSAAPVGAAYASVKLHYPKSGYVEISPDELWNDVITVIKNAVIDAKIKVEDVASLGISTQRATFLTWRKDNGIPLHNFVTWKDLRAAELIHEVNTSWKASAVRFAAYLIYLVTRNKKYGMGSRLKFFSNHVSVRLLWVLQNLEEVKKALKEDNLMFGTLETWLIYKFTGRKTYVTDISNASATGLYDPFELDWGFMVDFLKIPRKIFPPVVNTDFDFGSTAQDIFGVPVKIGCVMADQSSSMFGSLCFKDNDLKVTLGTAAFLDVNTSTSIHPSLNGMYPLVGWKTREEIVYVAEVPCSDAGSLIQWMLNMDFIDNPSKTSEIAAGLKDNGGVYFIPAFSGLGPPINNEKAATGFLGIKPTTKNDHIIRAVLESIVFGIALAFNMLKEERLRNYISIRVDGGVSQNNFICQMLADTTNVQVERLPSEMSALGVTFLAGISCGMWKNKEELTKLSKVNRVFKPTTNEEYKRKCKHELSQWRKAAERFKSWYEEN